MAEKRRGLGRGLGALIPSAAENEGAGTSDSGTGEASASATTERTSSAQSSKNKESKESGARKSSTPEAASRDTAQKASPSQGRKSGLNASSTTKTTRERKKVTGSADKSSKSASQSSTRRADMGAALRKSSGGRRPVDFFFQSSSEAVTDGSTSNPVDPAIQSSNDSSRGTKTGDTVSREMNEESEAGTNAGHDLLAVPGARFVEVPVKDIHPNRKQPRQEFDPDDMAELVHSIKEIGVLQPIVVRPSQEDGPEKYELVMGERRWRATQEGELDTIPAIVRETQNEDLLRDALLENLHRSQLNPLEEAAAYQQLLHEFNTTQEELSRRIGRSRPQISNTIRLLRLPALVQRRMAAGILSAGHARALLSLQDPAAMERLAQRIVAEGLSVRGVEEIIQSGAAEGQKKRPRKATPVNRHHERFDYIADAFADKLDTSVKINVGARKGKMTIEFASVEDLNRIISVLDPDIERS